MSYQSEVLADSPVAYYRLNEASGTTMADSSGNSRTGTYHNTASGILYSQTSLLTTDSDTSIKFVAASTGYGDVADNNALDLGNTFTLEAWIKLAALGQSTTKSIISKRTGAYLMRISTADKIALVSSQTGVLWTQSTALASTGPHHVVWTKSSTTSVLYVNGSSVSVTGSDLTLSDNALTLMIGADSDNSGVAGNLFDGWIDEVALYNTALSSGRVSAHYTAATVAGGTIPMMGLLGVGS